MKAYAWGFHAHERKIRGRQYAISFNNCRVRPIIGLHASLQSPIHCIW